MVLQSWCGELDQLCRGVVDLIWLATETQWTRAHVTARQAHELMSLLREELSGSFGCERLGDAREVYGRTDGGVYLEDVLEDIAICARRLTLTLTLTSHRITAHQLYRSTVDNAQRVRDLIFGGRGQWEVGR